MNKINKIDILIYNLNKKFDLNANTLFKLIYLFDWKCHLENLEQYSNLNYYFYINLFSDKIEYIPPRLLDRIFRKYSIDQKYIKIFNFICNLYNNDKENLNRIFISTYPYYINFFFPSNKIKKLNLYKISRKYKKYLLKTGREYVFI